MENGHMEDLRNKDIRKLLIKQNYLFAKFPK